jgi:hypothetical protein
VKNQWALAGVLVVSGALIGAEVLGEKKVHADYNVPAPTVTLNGNQANTNVAATLAISGPSPMGYQTAATNLFLAVKG